MRILLVNTSPDWGGGEAWALATATALRRRGHAVGIAAAPHGVLASRARAAGIEMEAVPPSPFGRWASTRRLQAWIAAQAPEVAIANAGPDVRRMAWLLRGGRTARILRRGLDRRLQNDAWHRAQYRRLDAILTNSAATRRTVLASCTVVAPEHVGVVHNGLDTAAFTEFAPLDVRSKFGIPHDAPVIGIVGRLTRQKAHVVAFAAFQQVKAVMPKAHLLVVGSGEDEAALRTEARRLGIEPHFTGEVNPVQPYYAACDLIVVPSWFEGFCYVAAEAQLLQRPVVASNASSLPEIVSEGATGLLVPPGDVAAFTAAIVQLASDPERCARMGQAGRAHVQAHFDDQVVVTRLEAFLRDASRWAEERGRA